jgi:hypothetical protein
MILQIDINRCRIAHQKSRSELEIELDTANDHELFEAFDAFVDLLVENLIKERAFPRKQEIGAI